jgi:hypothetical protein
MNPDPNPAHAAERAARARLAAELKPAPRARDVPAINALRSMIARALN